MDLQHKLNELTVTVKLSYAELNTTAQSLKFTRDMKEKGGDINELSGLGALLKDFNKILEGARDYHHNSIVDPEQPEIEKENIDEQIAEENPTYCATCD